MIKYEKVYSFNVLTELEKGEVVYMIDKDCAGYSDAISRAGKCATDRLLRILKDTSGRFEFYKIVESEDEGNGSKTV